MIPVMNVSRQYKMLKDDLDKAVLDILHSGNYILGETVEKFEKAFAKYCGVKYAVGVGNGTDALILAMKACGIKPGDEVITCAMSFFLLQKPLFQLEQYQYLLIVQKRHIF